MTSILVHCPLSGFQGVRRSLPGIAHETSFYRICASGRAGEKANAFQRAEFVRGRAERARGHEV
ncbi:hypothetical protein [Methylobacterium soli]|uniref:Uncharacterized protein n=1 Tax=Methylobacterium soli TaxID=553447 RepID=A0A6L3STB0_9HYPH|nr:hypothetical protein [Methylobacterium soli]KAB1071846.1 hypothetical protein F6X53_28745 [Methylobacterium soli]